MITHENWPENWSKVPAWTEVSEEIYNHFLDILPPLVMCGSFFQVSEPYSHEEDEKGRWRGKYMSFLKHDGKCWFVGINFAGHMPALEVKSNGVHI